MRKRTLQKAVTLFVCFVFLGLSASGLMAAETSSTPTVDPTLVLKAPVPILFSLFPFLKDLLQNNNPAPTQTTTDGIATLIRPTGTIKVVRLSGGD